MNEIVRVVVDAMGGDECAWGNCKRGGCSREQA